MTISRGPITTTSAISGFAIETFVIGTASVTGSERPIERSMGVMSTTCAEIACGSSSSNVAATALSVGTYSRIGLKQASD